MSNDFFLAKSRRRLWPQFAERGLYPHAVISVDPALAPRLASRSGGHGEGVSESHCRHEGAICRTVVRDVGPELHPRMRYGFLQEFKGAQELAVESTATDCLPPRKRRVAFRRSLLGCHARQRDDDGPGSRTRPRRPCALPTGYLGWDTPPLSQVDRQASPSCSRSPSHAKSGSGSDSKVAISRRPAALRDDPLSARRRPYEVNWDRVFSPTGTGQLACPPPGRADPPSRQGRWPAARPRQSRYQGI